MRNGYSDDEGASELTIGNQQDGLLSPDPWTTRSVDASVTQRLDLLSGLGYFGDQHPSVMVYDLDLLSARFKDLQSSFPPTTLHAVAVKAAPLIELLRYLVELGSGLEVASWGEWELARAAGCPEDRIVFDSPAKTPRELALAMQAGTVINANSAAELGRLEQLGAARLSSESRFGLRCNPHLTSLNQDAPTMVATPGSKFGVPLDEAEELLQRHPWVSGLHLHVGSQVATPEELTEGVRRVLEVADGHAQITWLDIGGGLPTRYRAEDRGLPPPVYLQILQQELPTLSNYSLITELGRALLANCAIAVSRVEYAVAGRAILHLGADFALREIYRPRDWWHEITVHEADGSLKSGPNHPVDLFGPLCFSGDCWAKGRLLPEIQEGDLLVIHDVGAYTLGMWSRFCSREMPEIVGWSKSGDLKVLKRRETPEDLVRFWSA